MIYFLASSFVLSAAILLFKNKTINFISVVMYLFTLSFFTIFSYIHIGRINSIYFKFDALSILMASMTSIISIGSFYHSFSYLKRKSTSDKQNSFYFASLIMFISAMMSAYYTQNFAVLWVSIEATTLFISILIFHTRTKSSIEATWKYLYISSIALAISFIGILFLSIIANSNGIDNLNMKTLIVASKNIDSMWLKVAFILITTGFSVKINLFPFHTVAIDAKTILASPINALMSTALVNVGFVGAFRVFTIISQTEILHWAQHILMIVGVVSILITVIQITRVKRLKRMFAFSSMEHMGLVFLGLAAGGIGYYGAIMHILFHSLIKAGLFFQLGSIRSFYKSIWIKDNGQYFRLNNWGGLALIVGVFSILAFPITGLFITEIMIFKSLLMGGYYFVSIFVLTLLSIIIFIVVRNTFHLLYGTVEKTMIHKNIKPNYGETATQFVLFGLTIYLGIAPPACFTKLIEATISVLN